MMRITDQSETDEVIVTFVETDTGFYVHWLGKDTVTGACTGMMVFKSVAADDPVFDDIHNFTLDHVQALDQKAGAINSPGVAEAAPHQRTGVHR
jgi:hypothetical protein